MMRGSSDEAVVAVGLLRVATSGHVDATARVVANAGCKVAGGSTALLGTPRYDCGWSRRFKWWFKA